MAALATVIAMLPVYLVGGMAIQLDTELGATTALVGIVVAVYWTTSALLSTTAGRLAQVLGSRWGLILAVICGFIALLGIGIITPRWEWLIFWLAIAGVANALSHPAANSLIQDQVSMSRRAFAFGLKQAAIPMTTLLSGLAVPALALTVGWRWAFIAAALCAMLLIPLLLQIVPKSPTRSGARGQLTTSKKVPRNLRPFLLATAVASGLGSAQANILGTFTVSAAFATGYDLTSAGLLLGAGSLAGCVVRPLAGIAADRGIGGSMATVSLMMAIGAAGLVCMASGHKVAYAIGCVMSFGFGWGWNGLSHYIVSKRSGIHTPQATGITQSGVYIGGCLGPLLFGFIFALAGPAAGWALTAVVAGLAASAAMVASRLEKALSYATDEPEP